jgi:hypothetical protein
MRVFTIEEHARERAMWEFFQENVPEGKKVLFIGNKKCLL